MDSVKVAKNKTLTIREISILNSKFSVMAISILNSAAIKLWPRTSGTSEGVVACDLPERGATPRAHGAVGEDW